ncbi:MAG: phosphatidate cytidylyltransferase [Clostridia bacterium]|nr:phosphatidate cytidylyltransferase [Clostridia bacterium]
MRTRIITAIVALFVFLPFLMFSDTVMFAFSISVLGTVACYEMLQCIGLKKKLVISIPSLLIPLLMPYAVKFIPNALELYVLVVAVYLLYMFGVAIFMTEKIPVQEIALAVMSVIYISIGFMSMVKIREYQDGNLLFLLVFIGAWMTDIFAYFSGRLFGKHKLIPAVSPKKTVEGAIGGTVCCTAIVMLYGFICTKISPTFTPNYGVLAICGLAASLSSQIGDLLMSVIKRKYGVKDYGDVFPGHGGVLDRFDSCIAVSVVLLAVLGLANMLSV